ncbi:MAG TPA: TlpA disulfide reductase family protein [Thermoanaerobaculia bacterium]
MLAQEVVAKYGGRVRFVSENWGESKLAARFGIERYPVVFVDDVLLARPEDFGWFGDKGRYTPWLRDASHAAFKRDLARTIDLVERGDAPAGQTPTASQATELARLPKVTLRDLRGATIAPRDLAGKVVLVEFWATWCPPCRSTLRWLGEVQRSYGDRVEVVAIAIQSDEPAVRRLTAPMALPYHLVLGSGELATRFGDITSVPTMWVFDGGGRTVSAVYGAPEDLHARVGRTLASLLGPPSHPAGG